MAMEMVLGMSEAEANEIGLRGADQGTQMKTDNGWYAGGNGTNSSGFSGLPGGYRYNTGQFGGAGGFCYLWSSTSAGATPAGAVSLYRRLDYGQEGVRRQTNSPRSGFSVRCIQNAE